MEELLAIRAHDVTRSFGDVIALDRIDLHVAQGRNHGLVGPNGAGKTTLLVPAGALGRRQRSPGGAGHARRAGTRRPRRRRRLRGRSRSPPLAHPGQNLAALAALRGHDTRSAAIDDVLDEVGLTGVADDRTRGFSLGMRQRLDSPPPC
ncbi:ATP-binding cassette domain-containing protein [Streptomyces sp. H51]|uniref:ATP-binding cassette domain-containing protein n=1 Tax=Streptomyces sp. H51 TaxID=3111770 RepID=UPI002D78C845|nr:ATP-binding cassette domain-containing protein [Streptomyces sp. H51]